MPVPPSQEDEAKMRDILSDPEVMKVLQDHQIQRLLTMMKTNPEAAQLWVVLQELTNCLWFSKIFQVKQIPWGWTKMQRCWFFCPGEQITFFGLIKKDLVSDSSETW